MAITLKACAMCRGATQLEAIGELLAEEGLLKMKVRGMPAVKCAKGHAAPLHQDFLLWLLYGLRKLVTNAMVGICARAGFPHSG